MEDPKEAEPPALAEGETGLHVDTDTPGHTAVSSVPDILSPVIESKFLYRSLQFSDLTLVERINSSKHHRLKRENFKKKRASSSRTKNNIFVMTNWPTSLRVVSKYAVTSQVTG